MKGCVTLREEKDVDDEEAEGDTTEGEVARQQEPRKVHKKVKKLNTLEVGRQKAN